MKVKKYYAVKNGRKTGIFESWDECKEQIQGFKGAIYKGFLKKEDAKAYLSLAYENLDEFDDVESLKENELIAYVDGSFNQKKGLFSYGCVLLTKTEELSFNGASSNEKCLSYRNVAGEVYGSVFSIKKAIEMGYSKIYLHYDYVGIRNWAVGDWKRNNELTARYYSFYQSIKDKIHVVFIKVDAHTGVKYNEMADVLAKKACGIA